MGEYCEETVVVVCQDSLGSADVFFSRQPILAGNNEEYKRKERAKQHARSNGYHPPFLVFSSSGNLHKLARIREARDSQWAQMTQLISAMSHHVDLSREAVEAIAEDLDVEVSELAKLFDRSLVDSARLKGNDWASQVRVSVQPMMH